MWWFLYSITNVAVMKNPNLKHLAVDLDKKFVNVVINALVKKWKRP
ncbi:MAG: hypothetical protein WBZ36_03510 [Candidatus Nitrosopolaris sp.]|jgi:hypothetical protein